MIHLGVIISHGIEFMVKYTDDVKYWDEQESNNIKTSLNLTQYI